MKKNLFILAAAALVFTGCSNDETVEVNKGNAISFRTAVSTRAQETTTVSLQSFNVTAIHGTDVMMDAVAFNKGNDGENSAVIFTSTPEYHWPADEETVTFYAVSPLSALQTQGTVTINSTTQNVANFTPADKLEEQVDFISANATGSKATGSTAVSLEFQHNLAQIEIQAKNTNSIYTYKIAGIKIARVIPTNTFNLATQKWGELTSADNNKTYEFRWAEPITLDGKNADPVLLTFDATNEGETTTSDNAMLIPQQLTAWAMADGEDNNKSYLAILVNVKESNGSTTKQIYPHSDGKYNWLAVGIDTNWEAGNKYTYTLDLSDGAGQVDPERKGDVDVENENYDPEKPNEPENPDKDDEFKPGQELLGEAIKFSVTVTNWNSGTPNSEGDKHNVTL